MSDKEFLQTLKIKIKEKGINWTAGITSVSELTYEEKKEGVVPFFQKRNWNISQDWG